MDEKRQQKIGELVLLVRILKTIGETEKSGLPSSIRPEMMAEWMDGDKDVVDNLITTFRGLMPEKLYTEVWKSLKSQYTDLDAEYLGSVLSVRRDYIRCFADEDTEGCKGIAAEAVNFYCREHNCEQSVPYYNASFAGKILQNYAETLGKRITEGIDKFGIDVIYEIMRNDLSIEDVQKLNELGDGNHEQSQEESGRTDYEIQVGGLLSVAEADDTFFVNIHTVKERLYLGYNNEVPDELKPMIVKDFFLDWVDEAIGITVSG